MIGGIHKTLLYSVLKITAHFVDEYEKSHRCAGTAFAVSLHGNDIHIVTNRHVVDMKFVSYEKKLWKLVQIDLNGYQTDNFSNFCISFDDLEPIYHYNDHIDIAAFNIVGHTYRGDLLNNGLIQFGPNFLAAEPYFSSLMVLDAVAFPYVHGNASVPIMRTGWISSDPEKDFKADGLPDDVPRLAIEGFSWSGYSGSPVFSLEKGLRVGPGLTGGGFREARLIGINAGHFNFPDGNGYHSGVSYLIKSTAIVEMLSKK